MNMKPNMKIFDSMKKIIYIGIIAIAGLLADACSLDNYDAPDSGLRGSILDKDTGEKVEQDIIGGSVINFIELGWENANLQKMVIKNDGTYCNSRMFAGKYMLYTNAEANFLPISIPELAVDGQMTLDIQVQPYIRLKNPKVFRSGDVIKAQFTIEQTTEDNCSSIALFVSNQQSVGFQLSEAAKIILPIGVHYDAPKQFTIELKLEDYPDIKKGKTYYFRIGALASAGGAKYNYAPAEKIKM